MARREDMHWSDVKAALEKQGSCLAEIALSLGISRVSVSKVSWRPNAGVQSTIAKALDTAPEAIWPTRYYVLSGKPIRPSIWMRKNSRRAGKGHVKNVKAA
ncbi:helix-turn-helix domain-containing protein [Magnetovibrio sp.]|uniref:helix-turn-helix domain-containing protein n=1 Tax=Magnetovibrio sp. TaxID=2024836 RepID=UPI002F92A51D